MAQIAMKQATAAMNGTSTVTTSAITTTAGNLLVVGISVLGASYGTPPVTDSKGNTWTLALSNGKLRVYYAENCLGGSGHTFTFTAGGNEICIAALEITDALTSSSLGNTNSTAASGFTQTSGTITSTHNDEIWIGFGTDSSGGQNPGVACALRLSGAVDAQTIDCTTAVLFKALLSIPDSTPQGMAIGYTVVSSGVTGQFAFIDPNGTSDVCGIVAFKGNPASGGGGGGGAWAFA